MKRLHQFILKSFLGPFIMTFFISLFVLLLQFLWKYIDDIVGKGIEWHIIAELLLYTSATLVPMALPLAILLSSIMTFGSLGENYELVALKSAGISLQKIMFPLIILLVIISVLAFFFTNNVMPRANLKFNALLFDVQNKRPQLSIKEGIFNDEIEGYSMKIGKKDNVKNMMYDIMIYDHKENTGNRMVTIAKSGTMNFTKDNHYLIMTLNNGCRYEEQNEREKNKLEKTLPHQRQKFEQQKILLDLSSLKFTRSNENLFSNNYQMYTIKQLNFAIDSLKRFYTYTQSVFADYLIRTTYLKMVPVQPQGEQAISKLNNINGFSNIQQLVKENTINTKDTSIKKNKIEPIKTKEQLKTDSIKKQLTQKTSLDSLYKVIKGWQRAQMINYALDQSRAAKTYISSAVTDLDFKMKNIKRHEIEWHRKFTLSFACLVLFFIGAPLGAIIRKGGLGMPVVVSVFFFIIYYVISISGEKFVREDILSSAQGMWLSSAILLPLGVFLTYKAAKESVIMNPEIYLNSIKQFFKSNKKKSEKRNVEGTEKID